MPLNNCINGQLDIRNFWVFVGLAFFLFMVIVYSPAIDGNWIFDDYENIVFNDAIKNLKFSLNTLFSGRGISYLSFAIDYTLWGLNPFLFRITNYFIHFINALLVVALSLEFFKDKNRNLALLTGALFLCHPLQTSAVNYIVQRMALLSTMFTLCSLLLLCNYFKLSRSNFKWQGGLTLLASVALGLLSVLSKENTVLLPLLVPFISWIILDKNTFQHKWKLPFFSFCIIPFIALFIQIYAKNEAVSIQGFIAVPLYEDVGADLFLPIENRDNLSLRYLFSQGEVFWIYLRLIFFPFPLLLDYSWPLPDARFHLLPILTFILIISGWFFLFVKQNKYPLSFFGYNWTLIFIAVESSIFPLDPIFEHRLYLPIIGVFLILVEQLTSWIHNKKTLLVLILISIFYFSLLGWQRNKEWGGTDTSFWYSNHKAVEKAIRPLSWLGILNFRDKSFYESSHYYLRLAEGLNNYVFLQLAAEAMYFDNNRNKAFSLLERYEAKYPDSTNLTVFRAFDAFRVGNNTLAKQFLSKAQDKSFMDLRIPYLRALIAKSEDNYLQATIYAQKVINERNKKPTTIVGSANDFGYFEWARSLREETISKISDWIKDQEKGINEKPEDVNLRVDYANQLLLIGMYEESKIHYLETTKLQPDLWFLYYNLGLIATKQYNYYLAADYYQKALKLSPGNRQVLENYADMLKRLRDYSKSEKYYNELTIKWPSNGKNWIGLGKLLEIQNNYFGARSCYEKALADQKYSNYASQAIEALDELHNK